MEALRFQVVGEAFKKKPLDVKAPSERPYVYFGKKVFNREKMYKYLPKQVYEKMIVDDALWPLPKYRELLFIR
ncbi:MAG: hypothetical protein IJ562_08675 [Prevotella sp.]|nr:hypothetical protein [Prevotella sp.]